MPIGPLELGIILVILVLIFGPKRLPGLGKQLGTGMREFKDSITGKDKDDGDAGAEPAQLVAARAAEPDPTPRPAATPEAAAAAPQAEDRPAAGA